MQRIRRLLALALAGVALAAPPAHAQAWPDKPVRILVPAPAGSSLDVLARAIGEKLKDKFGQPVVVDNKPAAGGTVATAETARAPADGSVILLGFNGPLATGPLIQKAPYDVQKDLAPVIITSSQPNVLAVNAELPVRRCPSSSRGRRRIRASSTTPRSATARARTSTPSC
jgi:tripartite-type tricarboxylate transporter receptor subunit TctC